MERYGEREGVLAVAAWAGPLPFEKEVQGGGINQRQRCASQCGETKGWPLMLLSRCFAFVRSGKACLDALIDFFAMDCDVFRSVDANTDLLAANAQNGDRDVVTDIYAFTDLAGEYQHDLLLDCFVGHLIQTVQMSVVRIDYCEVPLRGCLFLTRRRCINSRGATIQRR